MKKMYFLLIFGLLWTNALAQKNYSCDPLTDCNNGGFNGAYVPDPTNCEYYYTCIYNGGTYTPLVPSKKCDAGFYFDTNSGGCLVESTTGTCTNKCSSNVPVQCITECPAPPDGTFIADKNNCSIYYACLPSGPRALSCNSDAPYFDGTNCVTDPAQCCDFCTPYCSGGEGQLQDPCDCTSLYICNSTGVLGERITCESGYYYDETVVNCVPGTCSSLCSSSQCGITGVTEITSTPTPPLDGCPTASSYTCLSPDGNFPRCPYCDNSYFNCKNNVPTLSNCPVNELFNTNLIYPYCLNPSQFACPYNG